MGLGGRDARNGGRDARNGGEGARSGGWRDLSEEVQGVGVKGCCGCNIKAQN